MFNSKYLLALTLAAVFTVASAAPANVHKRGADASPEIEVCTGSINPSEGCVTIPVVSDSCVDFTGGFSFLNDELTSAIIPGGFICTFFEDFGCTASGTGNSGTNSEVVLQEGTWDFSDVPGLSGPEDFNDSASSFSCSPI